MHESYEVTKQLSIIGWFVIGGLYGLKDRSGDLRAGMTQSLDNLAQLAEPASTSEPNHGPGHASVL